MMILHIAMRELRSLFLSPLAWVIMAVMQIIMAWLFLTSIDLFIEVQAKLAAYEGAPGITALVAVPHLKTAAFLLLFVTPLLSMRMLSEEHRAQTLSLLFSAPLSMTEIILGKYLGLLGFLCIILLMFAAMPLSLAIWSGIDIGLFASAFIGLLLLVASFAAIGLFMSSLTAQPIIAAVSSLGMLLFLWIISQDSGVFNYLSIQEHFNTFTRGVFNSSDFIYYILLIVSFIVLSIRRLDAYRLQH